MAINHTMIIGFPILCMGVMENKPFHFFCSGPFLSVGH